MTKLILGLAVTTLAVYSGVAEARSSSEVEFRGYQTCLESAEKTSNGLVPSRNYYVERDGASAQYFISATRWADGEREYVRISCETAARGHRLVTATIQEGAFRNNEGVVRVEVAQK